MGILAQIQIGDPGASTTGSQINPSRSLDARGQDGPQRPHPLPQLGCSPLCLCLLRVVMSLNTLPFRLTSRALQLRSCGRPRRT
jgi:hypothetical protein